jgi:hypothetical protein
MGARLVSSQDKRLAPNAPYRRASLAKFLRQCGGTVLSWIVLSNVARACCLANESDNNASPGPWARKVFGIDDRTACKAHCSPCNMSGNTWQRMAIRSCYKRGQSQLDAFVLRRRDRGPAEFVATIHYDALLAEIMGQAIVASISTRHRAMSIGACHDTKLHTIPQSGRR